MQRAERSAFWNAVAVAPFCSRPRPDRGPLHCEPRGRGAALCGLRPGPAPPAPLRAPRRASPSAPHVPACGGPLLLAPPGRSRRCPLAGNGFSRPPSRTLPLLLPLVPSSPGVGVDAASREGSAAPPVRRRSLRTARGALWEDRRAPCPRLAELIFATARDRNGTNRVLKSHHFDNSIIFREPGTKFGLCFSAVLDYNAILA